MGGFCVIPELERRFSCSGQCLNIVVVQLQRFEVVVQRMMEIAGLTEEVRHFDAGRC